MAIHKINDICKFEKSIELFEEKLQKCVCLTNIEAATASKLSYPKCSYEITFLQRRGLVTTVETLHRERRKRIVLTNKGEINLTNALDLVKTSNFPISGWFNE